MWSGSKRVSSPAISGLVQSDPGHLAPQEEGGGADKNYRRPTIPCQRGRVDGRDGGGVCGSGGKHLLLATALLAEMLPLFVPA